jgi:hypothetical protein
LMETLRLIVFGVSINLWDPRTHCWSHCASNMWDHQYILLMFTCFKFPEEGIKYVEISCTDQTRPFCGAEWDYQIP